MSPTVEAKFHAPTYTLTYVVYDEATKDAIIIDPVLDYDTLRSETSTEAADELLSWVQGKGLKVRYILETHAHADHLTAAPYLRDQLGAPVVIGEHIKTVQQTFKGVFDLGDDFAVDGSQFDRLVVDGDTLEAGSLAIEVMHTPGHTPACVSYLVDDALFTGDALFMPDYGTGRCDFPNGSAEQLYESVHEKLYALPDDTRVFVGHDYQPGGRELAYESTIGAEKAGNKQLTAETSRQEFVTFRNNRDATLNPPRLIFQSVQVNIDGGRLPAAGKSGIRQLRLPLNLFRPSDELGRPKDATKQAS
jgi:glyoxylase-like metal-dependent hydrolase (beta-lactamase superfamily II)